MNDDEIRQLADEDYYHAQSLMMTTATPIGETVEGRDLFLVSTGAPLPAFNLGVVKADAEDEIGAIERAERYFHSRELPYRIQLRHDRYEKYAARLLEAGYQPVPGGPTPAMVMREIGPPPPLPQGLDIQVVQSDTDVQAFRDIVEEGFGMPKGIGPIAISDRVVAHPDTALLLGRVDGEPVATTLLIMTNRVAGIYMVATAEAHRKRGYGGALTAAGGVEGARRGALFASLQASAMGRPVYEALGFETLSTYHAYASPGSDPASGFGG